MKTFKNILLILVAMCYVTACEDTLELTDPDKTGPDIVFSSDANVKAALLEGYDALSAAGFFGGNALRNSELLGSSGELAWSGTFNDPLEIFNKQMTTVNGDVAATWIATYDAINVANNVLASLSVVNEDDRDQVEGECLFIRGTAYFELIKYYALPYSAGNTNTNEGVPIMDVEDRNSTAPVSRKNVEEVYAFILDDLTAAETLLEEGINPNRASRGAVAAMLSRVYLQMGNYAKARDAANSVIESGDYDLNATYAACFNDETTSEDIFDIPISTFDGVNSMNTFFSPTSSGGRGDIEILATHEALYDPADDRLDLFISDPANGKRRSGKWLNPTGYVKVIRLAEMYLTRAEANLVEGTQIGATPLQDINTIRSRVNLPDLTVVTLADVRFERRLELAQEGQRIHDIKRLSLNVVEGPNSYPYNDDLLVYPIPQRERNVNGSLSQNSGYGN